MFEKNLREAPLLSYPLASGDMRIIQVNERIIFLRNDAELGPVLRGEISGCGSSCYADLSQIFLEFGMNCKGCRDQESAEETIITFGERLGVSLVSALRQHLPDQPPKERLAGVLACVLNSMDVPFSEEHGAEKLHFTLAHCPLCAAGSKAGLTREMALARFGFAAFCESLVSSLSPEWRLIKPSPQDPGEDLYEIEVAKAQPRAQSAIGR